MVFPSIFLLFVLMPVLEIFVLIKVGSAIGAFTTIAIVIITAVLGTWMLRAQGLSTINKARTRLAGGEIPAFELLEGLALGVGGALLLTPGFITDAFGFACLLPPTRHLLVKALSKRVSIAGMASAGAGGYSSASRRSVPGSTDHATGPVTRKPASGDVIEGEFTRKD